jgi:hypothetical protein
VLLATALDWIGRRHPRRRPLVLAAAALVIVELLPAPASLYAAAVPRFYDHVEAAPADTRVLELPTGVRDGTSSVGDFTARTQFYQTSHNKLLIGGYLSRVSKARISEVRSNRIVDALIVHADRPEVRDGPTCRPARTRGDSACQARRPPPSSAAPPARRLRWGRNP